MLSKETELLLSPPSAAPPPPTVSLSQPWQCNTTCAEGQSEEGKDRKEQQGGGVHSESKEGRASSSVNNPSQTRRVTQKQKTRWTRMVTPAHLPIFPGHSSGAASPPADAIPHPPSTLAHRHARRSWRRHMTRCCRAHCRMPGPVCVCVCARARMRACVRVVQECFSYCVCV